MSTINVFELKTSDKPVKNMVKYGFIPEYDEYEDYLIHDKDNIDSLDPNYLLSISFENKSKIHTFYKTLKKIGIKIDSKNE
jgi:hypothetical protein